MENVNLLMDIGKLDWNMSDTETLTRFLQKLVGLISDHMKADICSIYIYDEASEMLTLRANIGFDPAFIGKISLKLGEGIAGTCLKELLPIRARDGFIHPNFKYFEGLNEEKFKAFLAVPMIEDSKRIGVIVLQRKEKNYFKEEDILALKIVASQAARILENVQFVIQNLARGEARLSKAEKRVKIISGKSASGGYAFGKIVRYDKPGQGKFLENENFPGRYTLEDFRQALKETENQLALLQKKVEDKLSDAAAMIFTAHLLILKDKSFITQITNLISQGENAPDAVLAVGRKYISLFSQSADFYLKEKAQDIADLISRVIRNIIKKEEKAADVKSAVILAENIYPSDLLTLTSENAQGVILSSGGETSHLVILARSLGIPVIIIKQEDTRFLFEGTPVILNAELGNIYLNPSKDAIKDLDLAVSPSSDISKSGKLGAVTKTSDGVRIKLLANINLLRDARVANELGCEGIGLYRSEFPFILRNGFPPEEEQYKIYQKLVEWMPKGVLTFRTLDIGGDKLLASLDTIKESNPFLGLRSIRFSMKNKELFVQQVKAVLRAAHDVDLRIMFPMISSLDEFITAKNIVLECGAILEREKILYNKKPGIGMMVEIPSAVSIIDAFAEYADFFSIGTNDLVQYTLAVDRTNEEVADYFVPHHPAVLKAIKIVADAGKLNNLEVSVCGDMANNPKYIPFLIGSGITILSMDKAYLLKNQKLISEINYKEAEKLAKEVLNIRKISDLNQYFL